MTAAFVVFTAVLFWCAVFMIFFAAQGTTPWDFLLGGFEPPPSGIGTWRESGVHEGSLRREERFLFPHGDEKASTLLHQVRYRDADTEEIVRVEPERRVRRRRARSR